jgi:hypothetical protein
VARRGIPLSQISKWVNGECGVSPESRPLLAAALGISQLELEAMLPRPGRRSRDPQADWHCRRHRPRQQPADEDLEASA